MHGEMLYVRAFIIISRVNRRPSQLKSSKVMMMNANVDDDEGN
jgi:hypothetical protein